jgi:LCP family protein required for cell wall assembly
MPDSRSRSRLPFAVVPDQNESPVVWDQSRRQFVPVDGRVDGPVDGRTAPVDESHPVVDTASPRRDERSYFVGPEHVGKRLPPQPGGAPGVDAAAPAATVQAPPRPPAAPPRTPPPQPQPAPAAPPPQPPRTARTRRRGVPWKWIVALAVGLPIVLLAAGFVWAQRTFNRIEKVPVGDLLDPAGSGTNYLIVGSDSRDGIDPSDPNAGAIVGEGAPAGQRSDTIMILRIEGDRSLMLSIPRDLLVTVAETGAHDRVNSAYNGGPGRLIKTVKDNLGIPINRYLEVDFVTFAGLVDAVGGITIDFPHPAFDDHSGLNVTQSGPVKLDGTEGLAYVRSRFYTEVIDGVEQRDPTADLGRVKRQQAFLRAVLAKAGHSHNPITLMRVASSVSSGIRIDDRMTMLDAFRLAWRMGRLDPQSVELPVTPTRTSGGAAVLELADGADAALANFRD